MGSAFVPKQPRNLEQSWIPKPPDTPLAPPVDQNRLWVPAPLLTAGELTATNDTGAVLVAGTPVHRTAINTVVKAYAGSSGAVRRAEGLVLLSSQPGAATRYLFTGPLMMGDWTAVAGTEFLTPGAAYYLGSVAGMITTAFPARSAFALLQLVGVAQDEYTLDVTPDVYEVDL